MVVYECKQSRKTLPARDAVMRSYEMTKITLTNDYHNTEAVVIPTKITEGRFAGCYKITRKTAQRLVRELCVPGCSCSGTFGERGGHVLTSKVINEDSERNYILSDISFE